jgi:xanthine dehydrogenase accessory factor
MPVTAPLRGVLRGGLTHDGVPVAAGTKVIEIDPRGNPALVHGIGERPARIAAGVLRAIDAALRLLPQRRRM